jgi:hypothetical protein
MNKIFFIKMLHAGYCEDEAFIVIAKDKKEAWNLIKPTNFSGVLDRNIRKGNIEVFEQIGYSYRKKRVVLVSNAGS